MAYSLRLPRKFKQWMVNLIESEEENEEESDE